MNDLPMYNQEEINGLVVVKSHSETMSEAWLNYAKAIDNLVMIHEEYKKSFQTQTLTKSLKLAYQAALINLESAKASIQEIKDLAYTTGINEWLP